MRAAATSVIRRAGITEPAVRALDIIKAYEPRTIARNIPVRLRGAPDGLPLPPSLLVFNVAGTGDLCWFLDYGERCTLAMLDLLRRHAAIPERFDNILDFGCGCGRIIRHWSKHTPAVLHGTDLNRHAIEWCRSHLPIAQFQFNGPLPPTGYPAAMFDFVYCFSVFTHLPAEQQQLWLAEMKRILRPGGYLLLTTHGASFLNRLTDQERHRFTSGQLVVRGSDFPGANLCASFHPESYVRHELAPTFELLEFMPAGADSGLLQDVSLFRAR